MYDHAKQTIRKLNPEHISLTDLTDLNSEDTASQISKSILDLANSLKNETNTIYSQVCNRSRVWIVGELEKILKTNSQGGLNSRGLEKSGKFKGVEGGEGGGEGELEFRSFFLSFLTIRTTYCRTFYIQ